MSVTHSSNEDIIGRDDINDVEAILAVVNTDVDEVEHVVKDNADAIFTWDYSLARPQLRKLYEKAKVGQWNATTDLDWDTEVDVEKVVSADRAAESAGFTADHYDGTVVEKWGDKEWLEFSIDQRRWTLSQFLHGEQGALLCTAKIVETVPWYDAKLYASTQTIDEARHVEVFHRYLDEKMGGGFQVNAHLRMLLDDIINDSRWDMTYLGMQVMVEGLALAAFGFMHQMTEEPLLKKMLRYVMSDEARHVAFGVLSLKEVYEGMTDAEMKERQEFAFEAAIRMRDRFLSQEVWERHGVNPRDVVPLVLKDPTRDLFQMMLFSKIVPNCKKLGLLDRNDQWLRRRFEEMNVIQFEDWEDTGSEYLKFELDAEAPIAGAHEASEASGIVAE
ncbi:ferritin-like domain-containing protein [Ilumatobacter sp.]|uniref:ferritin-like domain-containing protein n=1 Tax=Ilumatobacter sp. TaxID=1967498 RepID=UPI003AF4CFF5